MRPFARRLLLSVLASFCGGAAMAQAPSDRLRLALQLTSDFKQNGLSQSASDPAARLALDFEHPSGFFAGGFVSTVEYAAEKNFRSPRDSLVDVYAGYQWRRPQWSGSAFVSRYVYPGSSIDYDYTQATGSFSLRNRYFFEVSGSDKYMGIYGRSLLFRGGFSFPVRWDLDVGMNAGHFDASGRFDASYEFWDVGVSRVLGRFALDLRYHDNGYASTTLYGDGDGDRWVFSVAYAITPRNRDAARR